MLPNRIRLLVLVLFLGALVTLPLWVPLYGCHLVADLPSRGTRIHVEPFSRLFRSDLGQQMFIGVGGYSLAVLSMYHGLPIFLSVFLGGVISVLLAILISMPVFRMKGVYFAIGTKDPEFIKVAQEQLLYTVEYRQAGKVLEALVNFDKRYGPKLAEAYK